MKMIAKQIVQFLIWTALLRAGLCEHRRPEIPSIDDDRKMSIFADPDPVEDNLDFNIENLFSDAMKLFQMGDQKLDEHRPHDIAPKEIPFPPSWSTWSEWSQCPPATCDPMIRTIRSRPMTERHRYCVHHNGSYEPNRKCVGVARQWRACFFGYMEMRMCKYRMMKKKVSPGSKKELITKDSPMESPRQNITRAGSLSEGSDTRKKITEKKTIIVTVDLLDLHLCVLTSSNVISCGLLDWTATNNYRENEGRRVALASKVPNGSHRLQSESEETNNKKVGNRTLEDTTLERLLTLEFKVCVLTVNYRLSCGKIDFVATGQFIRDKEKSIMLGGFLERAKKLTLTPAHELPSLTDLLTVWMVLPPLGLFVIYLLMKRSINKRRDRLMDLSGRKSVTSFKNQGAFVPPYHAVSPPYQPLDNILPVHTL